jgi:Fic family protein
VKKYGALLPHICHYYILYIHPYFDYNGRTARMVSFWLNYIFDINDAPLFMSEAINDNKKEYYRAITNTRNTYNDLTYFLGYILETAIKYSLVYKNLEEVKEKLSKTGDTLTSTEWGYLKKIIIHNSTGYFTYKDFFEYIHSTMTKQGGLKILNAFVEYNLLIKDINKKKEAIYKVNPEILTYKFQK